MSSEKKFTNFKDLGSSMHEEKISNLKDQKDRIFRESIKEDFESIPAGSFEAVLGAIYLDQGLKSVQEFLLPLIQTHLAHLMNEEMVTDHKSHLQEMLQKMNLSLPKYTVIQEEGPQHARLFHIQVMFQWKGRVIVSQGTGESKKIAEQAAAKDALLKLENKS